MTGGKIMMKKAVTNLTVHFKTGAKLLLLTIFMLIIAQTMKPMDVYASTQYTDQENNNSFAEAQFIGRNAMPPASRVSGDTQAYRYVTGTVYIDILNENEEIINSFSYDGTASAENVFHVDVGDY